MYTYPFPSGLTCLIVKIGIQIFLLNSIKACFTCFLTSNHSCENTHLHVLYIPPKTLLVGFQFSFNVSYITYAVWLVMSSNSIVNSVSVIADFLHAVQIWPHHPVPCVIICTVGLAERMLKIVLHLCQRLLLPGLQQVCVDLFVVYLLQQRHCGVRTVFDHRWCRILGDVLLFYPIGSDLWVIMNIIRMKFVVG